MLRTEFCLLRHQAAEHAEALRATLEAEGLVIDTDVRRLTLCTVADPRARSDALLILADALREVAHHAALRCMPVQATGIARLAALVAELAPERV